jgi:hypothetical protein
VTDRGQAWYVYGITAADFPPLPDLAGVGEGAPPVETLPAEDLQVLLSLTAELGPDPTEENVRAHQRVLAAVMALGTVIPCAFGCVLPEPLISGVVSTARAECLRLLKLLEGKIEVGLKLFWQKEAFLPDLQTREIADLCAQLKRAVKGRKPALEARLGEKVAAAADRKRAEYQRLLYEPLARAAVAARLGDTIGPRMILNASFLIERTAEARFDELVSRICGPHLPRLDVRFTGPWPPYNFVTLRMQVGGGE